MKISHRTSAHRQLQRLFKQNFGVSPATYYLRLRLEHGDDLLRKTSMDILDIAIATGFSSSSHFSRSYRRQYGLTPGARRKSIA